MTASRFNQLVPDITADDLKNDLRIVTNSTVAGAEWRVTFIDEPVTSGTLYGCLDWVADAVHGASC